MCLSPIFIKNKSKYYTLSHKMPFEISCKCGNCPECNEEKSKEWLFRAYYESLDTFSKGDHTFIYMDTLTYSNKNLPHLSDFYSQFKGFSIDNKSLDFPCFNYFHIREFMQILRMNLKRLGYDYKDNLKYFITSEYGTTLGKTHRPHYHILLYVTFKINPYDLSKLVSKCWRFGRTDGYGYKSRSYIMGHNTIFNSSPAKSKYLSIKYVSKYVQKSSLFDGQINNRLGRISNAMELLNIPLVDRKKFMSDVKHYCCQFHRQSQGFGLYALNNIDFKLLDDTGLLVFPSFDLSVNYKIPLPLYFKRKLFYDLKTVDGKRIWSLNKSGEVFMKKHLQRCVENISLRLQGLYENLSLSKRFQFDTLNITFIELANYMVYSRGRCRFGEVDFWDISKKSDSDFLIYNYSSINDLQNFGFPFFSKRFLGNDVIGYDLVYKDDLMFLDSYKDYMCFRFNYEEALNILNYNNSKLLQQNSEYQLHMEKLTNIFKKLGLL